MLSTTSKATINGCIHSTHTRTPLNLAQLSALTPRQHGRSFLALLPASARHNSHASTIQAREPTSRGFRTSEPRDLEATLEVQGRHYQETIIRWKYSTKNDTENRGHTGGKAIAAYAGARKQDVGTNGDGKIEIDSGKDTSFQIQPVQAPQEHGSLGGDDQDRFNPRSSKGLVKRILLNSPPRDNTERKKRELDTGPGKYIKPDRAASVTTPFWPLESSEGPNARIADREQL